MLAVKDEKRQGRLWSLDIEGLDIERAFYLIRDKRRTVSPLARAFHTHLLRSLNLSGHDVAAGTGDRPIEAPTESI